MASQKQLDQFYVDVANRAAQLSYCNRRKVGSIIVKNGNILAYGYNGTEPGGINVCEDADGNTKPNVIHAERNAIRKLYEHDLSGLHEPGLGATIYVNLTPCLECAILIVNAGITEVVYTEDYRCNLGFDHLRGNFVKVRKYEI